MAQLISVKLSRFDGSPWGFRLQGGKDFGTPLIVQKVNGGSPAEAAGLRAGDAVIRVNSTDMFNLRHKDAQDVIVKAGNNFEMTVQRGGSTWKPSVTPLTSSLPNPAPAAPVGSINPVTKTSLAAKKQDVPLIGSGHNFSPKPFLNGTSDGSIKSIVNKQYNSPVGIYSEETIAETLSAQAEVLAGGVLGVNFKKNEKNYNAENSEVFKMVQEADKEPKTPEPAELPAQSGVITPSSPALAGLRPVSAPETKQPQPSTPQTPGLPPGQNICAECERLIVGVFVRIKDKNLHVECFKCSTCGTSLKNVGYYNINSKLYCDIHAKMVARQNAPSGLVPITVPPGGKAPAGTISAALSNITAPLSPPLSNHGSSPQPFATCNRSSPDNGFRPARGAPLSSHGCLKNGECNGESRTFTSTLTIQTGGGTEPARPGISPALDPPPGSRSVQAPTSNNLIGPKPFGSSTPTTNLSSAPTFNSGSNTLTRPQSQTVTETYETSSYYELTEKTTTTNPQPPRPQTPSAPERSETPSQFSTSHTPSHFYQSSQTSSQTRKSCCRHSEDRHKHCAIEATSNPRRSETPSHPSRSETPSNIHRSENTSDPPCPERSSHPSSVKSKSLAWPPPKPIEDITYPTASPLYIDPNPVLERKSQQAVRERRAGIEACEKALKRRSVSTDRSEDWCSYECRRRGEDAMERVSCPGPVYRRVELVDTSARQSRSETRSETVSRPSSTDSLRRSLTPTRIVQPVPKPWTATVTSGTNIYEQSYPIAPPEHGPEQKLCKKYSHREVCQREKLCERGETFREEERTYRSDIRRSEQLISPKPPLPPQPSGPKELRQEIDMKVIDLTTVDAKTSDLAGIVPPDVSATITLTKKKETGTVTESAEHDLVTEYTEEDAGDAHIVKSSTFEKTVESRTPERSNTPVEVAEEAREAIEESAQTASREVEESVEETCRAATREVTETIEKRYESKRMEVEEHKTVGESADLVTSAIDAQQLLEKARQDEEERKREEEEEERRKEEEEKRRREEEERRAQEKWRKREEEERKQREEEEERLAKHVSFSEEQEYEETETVNERPLGRKVIREEHVTTTDSDTPGREKITKEIYEEITEEVLVQERVKRRDIDEDDRRRSLREQVEVHQNLRESQVPRRFGESLETSKKHVQFMKQTESGPQPIPHSAIQNSTPKEWKSEMVNALTTAPDRPYTPLSKSSSVKEVYTEETIYLNRRGPRKEPRAISPFQKALMIAPERPYTPLGREIGDEDQHLSRSGTPSAPPEGHCPPSDILYSDVKAPSQKVCKKKEGPRPLPTPPPDYRFRETSVSPVRSRPETPKERPSSRSLIAGLKKPDTIPAYQRNLVAMKKEPVESRPYTPSRTPTPASGRTKSPSDGLQEPAVCHMKAPRIKEDPPSQEMSFSRFPGKKYVSYKVEEDTPDGHKSEEYTGAKSCEYTQCRTCDGPAPCLEEHHSRVEERRYMKREEEKKEERVRRALEVTEELESCEKHPVQAALEFVDECTISKVSKTPPSLPCPVSQPGPGKQVNIPIQSSYKASTEVKHVKYDTAERESSSCPETGLTVLPCKAISDTGSKVGVVVVPCEGPRSTCTRSGICVVPTKDRAGVCVSPCFDRQPGKCGQPSGCCGRESAGCEFDVRNCSDSGVCVMPNPDGSISVAPCNKPVKCSKEGACGASPRTNLPFPQIPLPYEEDCTKSSSAGCTTSFECTSSSGCTSSFGCAPQNNDCNFEPIHKPRTNLSGQLARLTAKRDIPTIQLYKPQAQAQTQSQCDRPGHCPPETNSQTRNHCQGQFQAPSSKTQRSVDPPNLSSHPDIGSGIGGLGGAGSKSGSFAGSSAPKRGRGILNQASGPGSRLPLCAHCNSYVRGPFITALGQIWCPEHFVCVNTQCRRPLQDIGFVEEKGQLYCEYCFERFIAPACNKCNNKIKGDCLNAIGKHFHPECFNCSYCGKLFGNSPFFLEEGLPYCEADWNELFTTKCFACGFPVEAGDRWVEALNNNYHSQCFNCTMCKKNLEGQSFYAKGGRPFCKNHAR